MSSQFRGLQGGLSREVRGLLAGDKGGQRMQAPSSTLLPSFKPSEGETERKNGQLGSRGVEMGFTGGGGGLAGVVLLA